MRDIVGYAKSTQKVVENYRIFEFLKFVAIFLFLDHKGHILVNFFSPAMSEGHPQDRIWWHHGAQAAPGQC